MRHSSDPNSRHPQARLPPRPRVALRTTGDLSPSKRSAKVGDRIEFGAKVENGGASPETVLLAVEDLKQAFAFSFQPASVALAPKSRARVTFAWTAALPEGVDALTFRGKLVLRAVDGKLVGSGPLDLYVSRS